MSYVTSSLDDDERVIYHARLSVPWLVGRLLISIPLCLILVGVFMIYGAIVRFLTTEIAVTNSRFIFKTGFISRRVNEVSLRKIEGVSLSQGVVGRLFGFGTVQVRGTGSDRVNVALVNDPLALRREVNRAAEEIGSRPTIQADRR